ncbi:MAG: FAD-dependent oxidoreductase [Chloroflexi bacterium]|nr:FAD-dependent oxidoreductase [Chloroflexota bacterium]
MDAVTDVLVIGFGAAGSAAAIEAADAGSEVMILEKMRQPGGAAKMSGGMVYGAGTSVQRAAGITDTPDEMYKYLMASGDCLREPALVRITADRSGEAIEWLINLGVVFAPEEMTISGAEREYEDVTPPKARTHHVSGAKGTSRFWTGPGLFAPLQQAVEARKIDVRMQTAARELVVNSRRKVVGVKATSQGRELTFGARKAVIIADGGFTQNREMLKQYLFLAPHVEAGRIALTSHPGQTGDGIRMAMAVGADLMGIGWAHGRIWPIVTGHYPSIWVNTRGVRFTAEHEKGTNRYQEPGPENFVAFEIFDDRVMRLVNDTAEKAKLASGKGVLDYMAVNLSEYGTPQASVRQLKSAPTVRELATELGLPVEQLETTVKRWNRHAETGQDPEFDRTGPAVMPISTPPFWGGALRRRLSAHHGGLRTDARSQVVSVLNGTPIPRLYAAGQTTGGRVGMSYPGSGFNLAACFVFGRIAGQNAAAESPWE